MAIIVPNDFVVSGDPRRFRSPSTGSTLVGTFSCSTTPIIVGGLCSNDVVKKLRGTANIFQVVACEKLPVLTVSLRATMSGGPGTPIPNAEDPQVIAVINDLWNRTLVGAVCP